MSPAEASRVEGLLSAMGLPVRIAAPDVDAVLAACEVDKKRLRGKHRLPLPMGIGGVTIVEGVAPEEIRDAVAYIAR
jgi:3-dehydroquinate synthetase